MNPFVFDRPLDPTRLVDRRDELEQLLALAQGGHGVRLAAPRRFGKTTLLGALAHAAEHAHEMVPALVDFSRVTSLDDVVARVTAAFERGLDRGPLRATWRGLRRRGALGAELAVPGLGGLSASVGPGADEAALTRLHAALDLPREVHARTGRRCLVILDEFQDLLTVHGELDGVLRSHLQHHGEAASYVFAGSQPSLMRALFGDRRRPLFDQARALELGRLPGADLADFVEAELSAGGRDDLVEHVDLLVSVAAGHPQRAMLLAHFLFEQPEDEEDPLGIALAAALRQAADGLDQGWRDLSSAERRLLGAVAAGHARPLGNDALAFTRHGKGTQAKVRDQLMAAGHLELGPGGRLAFIDPLLPLWLRPPPTPTAP